VNEKASVSVSISDLRGDCGGAGEFDTQRVCRTNAATGGAASWPYYGRDQEGTRYIPLDQINRRNVAYLELAWEYHTGDFSDGSDGRPETTFQATPILVDGILYLATVYGRVIALNPETGAEIWKYDPGLDATVQRGEFANRGVTYWRADAAGTGSPTLFSYLPVVQVLTITAANAQAVIPMPTLLSLRASTGELVWHFQIVHHNIWDYDLPAQPSLITVRKEGRDIPAVAQPTKMGFLYLLDRETVSPFFRWKNVPCLSRMCPASKAGPPSPSRRLPARWRQRHSVAMTRGVSLLGTKTNAEN
jgi:glucose dehydrogenase